MKGLDSEKSWELLLKKASINGKCPDELESIGRQIVEKCCGLPLAISVVGGLLVGTRTKSEWQRSLKQINSYLEGEKSHVSRILELSYHNLSPQLKPCFLFLAIFKEDYTIRAERLINIWVAQGLIQKEGNNTVDEIGRGYLNELINRSMLQIQDLTIDDQVQNCRLHDLLRDLCLSKAKEETGLKIVGAVSCDESSSHKTRHRVVYSKNLRPFSSKQNKHLRSLFLLNVGDDDDNHVRTTPHYWKSFQLLKTLDLERCGFQRLPRSFGFLLGLKYLRISRDQGSYIELQLPVWFDRLKKLEVFHVDSVRFPDAPLKMESLRHFRVFRIDGKPISIANWKNIETLNRIRPQDLLEISSTITANSHLRVLTVCVYERGEAEVLSRASAALAKMTNLARLCLQCSPGFCSLSELKLDATVFPPNLSDLRLDGELDDVLMEEVGKLPNLMYLTLWDYGRENGVDWRMTVTQDGFPCLEALSLNYMHYLRGIDIEQGGMPRLERLRIYKCPNLGTQNLPEHITISLSK